MTRASEGDACAVRFIDKLEDVEGIVGRVLKGGEIGGPTPLLELKRDERHDQDVLPYLSIHLDEKHHRVMRFRLVIGVFNRDQLKGIIGYRFEGPEGEGRHHYYHAQPIRGLEKGCSLPRINRWFPDKMPTFPLYANNDIELLLALLVSLGGLRALEGLNVRNHGLKQKIDEYHKGLTRHASPAS